MKNAVLQTLTDSQRTFVTAAEALGATSPAASRTSGELPRISARELGQLLDTGIVRESAQGSFYIYDRARPDSTLESNPALASTSSARDPRARRRLIVKMVIVMILLLLPILFLRLGSPGP